MSHHTAFAGWTNDPHRRMQRGTAHGFASFLKPQTLPDSLAFNSSAGELTLPRSDGSGSKRHFVTLTCRPEGTVKGVIELKKRGVKRRRLSNQTAAPTDGGASSPGPQRATPDVTVSHSRASPPTTVPDVAPVPAPDRLHQIMALPALFSPVRKPRNPIVLCHGLYGFDVRGPAGSAYQLHYWGAILEILRGKVGAEVIVSRVPGTGSIEGRARALDAVLRKEVAGRDINLLAHSMGGLDARFLISNIKPDAYKVLSLTTISTPHRGSPFMEWCSSRIGLGRDVEADSDDPARSTLAHWMGVGLAEYFAALFDSPAYRDLLPSYLEKRFNPVVPDMPSVRYYSVAARSGALGLWHPLYWPKAVLDASEAKALEKGIAPPQHMRGNDGLVTVESAQWGNFLGTVDHCDHWRIRGSSGFRSVPPLLPEGEGAARSLESAQAPAATPEESATADAIAYSGNVEPTKELKVQPSDAAKPVTAAVLPVKPDASGSWSWEDVNTIVDPLRALVSPLNRLLSMVPTRSNSTLAITSEPTSTTRFISPSLTFFKSAKPLGTSPTTRYITLSHVASPLALAESQTSRVKSSSAAGGLLSYFRRAPSNTPSPTTRYLQLSLVFSPLREPPPSAFRAMPGLSNLLAPPNLFGNSTHKSDSRQGHAADAGARDAFDLERLYVALARNLHDEGL